MKVQNKIKKIIIFTTETIYLLATNVFQSLKEFAKFYHRISDWIFFIFLTTDYLLVAK